MSTTATTPTITAYADTIMAAIADDIAEGIMPMGVRTFGELHEHVDANDYTQAADVPWGADIATADDPAGMNLTNAVQDEVTRRLNAPGRPYCTHGTCKYKHHDHTTLYDLDGNNLATPVPMQCLDCAKPTHYDEKAGDYRHDDPDVPACFLVPWFGADQVMTTVEGVNYDPTYGRGNHPRGDAPDPTPLPSDLDEARAEAERQATCDGKYPQYRGLFTGYGWGVANGDVRTKLGLTAKVGERVLAFREGAVTVTFWSVRTQMLTEVPGGRITLDVTR